MAKPKPAHPKKCISLNLDQESIDIVEGYAMSHFRGNVSEAARRIFQDWDNLRTPSITPPVKQ